MSPNARRLASILGAALLLGVLGNLLLGASPAAVKPVAAAELPWQPVAMRVPDLAAADQVWEARAPWGAAPKPVEPPPVPPPPPPMPVGIVGAGNAKQAIFLVPGAGELRLGAGGALPDGGHVLEVSAMKVSWVDGAGERHERRMFVDTMEIPAGAGAGPGATAGAPAQSPGAAAGMPPSMMPGQFPGNPSGSLPGPGGRVPGPAAMPGQAPPSPAAMPSSQAPAPAQPGKFRRNRALPSGVNPNRNPGGS